jgi:uncharacterized membrane protein
MDRLVYLCISYICLPWNVGANEQTIVCGARAVKLFVFILWWSKSCMKRFKKLREIIDVHVQYSIINLSYQYLYVLYVSYMHCIHFKIIHLNDCSCSSLHFILIFWKSIIVNTYNIFYAINRENNYLQYHHDIR